MKRSIVTAIAGITAFCFTAFPALQANAMVTIYNDRDQLYEGSTPRVTNDWIRLKNSFGCYVWRYVDENGNYLTDTTTPDGYYVNSYGNWYVHCPSAEICELDPTEAYSSFSYDGETANNDTFGISLKYNADDYISGTELCMYNNQASSYFAIFNVTFAFDAFSDIRYISVRTAPHETREDIIQEINRRNSFGYSYQYSYTEKTIAGKTMQGINGSYAGTPTIHITLQEELRYPLPTGQDLLICFEHNNSPEELTAMETWLSEHLVLSK